MNLKKKGQLSVEFIVIFGIILLLFIITASIFIPKTTIIQDDMKKIKLQNYCNEISYKINTLALTNNNIIAKYKFPKSVGEDAINISLVNNTFILSTDKDIVFCRINSNVSGIINNSREQVLRNEESNVNIV